MNTAKKTTVVRAPSKRETKTWKGSKGLRSSLAAVADVTPFPGNPRRGDVVRIAESLERFGQVRPILIDSDGRIVAGNHTYLAARSLGWSHVAVTRADHFDDAEARAYLVADNRLSDLAEYDQDALRELLVDLRDRDSLAGTGFRTEEVEDFLAEYEAAAARARQLNTAPEDFPGFDPDSIETNHECPKCGYRWSGGG